MTPLLARFAAAINTSGIQTFVVQTIIPILLLVIGVGFIAGAKKGRFGEVMTTATIVIVGLVFIFGAAGLVAFGDDLADVVFTG